MGLFGRLDSDLSERLQEGRERCPLPGRRRFPAAQLGELLTDSRIDQLIDETQRLAAPPGVVFLSDGYKDK